MSLGTVCRCCGERIQAREATNPNICFGCAQLLEDESPIALAADPRANTLPLQPLSKKSVSLEDDFNDLRRIGAR
jgi:hypothetical protein